MRIGLISLSSCQGCQMVFLGLEEYLYSFISENKVSYAPFLMDEKDLPEVDLVLVEGTVRNGDHFRKARLTRDKAASLVALGSCACFGGVQGLANMVSEEELIRRGFGDTLSFQGGPPGVKRLLPLDSYIKVDAFLPGCPPPAGLLRVFLQQVLSGELPSRDAATVCSECRVSSPALPQSGLRRMATERPQPGRCLLEQGFICMGPLTRDGCGARCPSELGVPCIGCRGPSQVVMTEPYADMRLESIRRLARATGHKTEEIEKEIKDPAQTFFKFCLAEPSLRRRRTGGTAPYIYRLGEEG
ncbi:MAG: hypothetical protein SWK76_11510 [Actinomycetota bacterium]|nr:hypothetical protein [Actinomycetota bacterium]